MSTNNKMSLAGIYPTLPTPFFINGDIDLGRLRRNLLRNSAYCSGYVLQGSNGEYVFLDHEERVSLVRAAREIIPSSQLLIVGAGMESTSATIDLTKCMSDAGADIVLVITPHYYRGSMSRKALEHHYMRIASKSPVPVLLYSAPMFTGLDLPVEVIKLLSGHNNIIGIKESSGDVAKIKNLVHETPKDFEVLTGSASQFLAGLNVGAVGGILALANIAAKSLSELMDLFGQGEMERAEQIQICLVPVTKALKKHCGIAGLKAALEMIDQCGGEVRSPLLPLLDSEKIELRSILEKTGLL
jgi:4-hydroxy-2-oxoglutarate aldolase